PLSRDFILLELPRLPGAAREHPLPHGGEEDRLPAHAERFGPGHRADADRDHRELPAGVRLDRDPRGAAEVHERRGADHEVAKSTWYLSSVSPRRSVSPFVSDEW